MNEFTIIHFLQNTKKKIMKIKTKYGWVSFDNLKHNNGCVSWESAINENAKIPFCCDGIDGVCTILAKGKGSTLLVTANGLDPVTIKSSQIKNGNFKKALHIPGNTKVLGYRYNVGDMLDTIEILEQTRYKEKHSNNSQKAYRCKCLKDKYEWVTTEHCLKKGSRCPVCSGNKVFEGVNDIATTLPDIASLFVDADEAKKYSMGSNENVLFRCPDCNLISEKSITTVTHYGFHCPFCGDGVSYPNKYVRAALSQVVDNVKAEVIFEWSKSVNVSWDIDGKMMRYDVYLPDYEIIIENQGGQHYHPEQFTLWDEKYRTQVKENDEVKRRVAEENGYTGYHYIELDCRVSDSDYIKSSILNSKLPEIIGFTESDIDFSYCEKIASSSIVANAWSMWNRGIHDKEKIALEIGVVASTVDKYLKRGLHAGTLKE